MTAERADLIVHGGIAVTMDEGRTLLRDGAVAVRDGTILAVDKLPALRERYAAERILSSPDGIVMPGLIDCHNHPGHFLSKGMIDDMAYPQRWRERVWPYEAGLSEEEAEISATGTFIEMIRNGTTCFYDPGSFAPDAVARAARRVGIRGVLSRLTWDVADEEAPGYDDPTEIALGRAEETIEAWHGAADGRLRGSFSLVRAAHVSDVLCRSIKERADARGVGIHAHLCTSRAEVEASIERWGMTPVARYAELGVLGPSTQLVHMGWIREADIPLLRNFDVTVCHCPSASMFGGFGCIAHGRFPELIEAGVRVVLGSDACAVSRFVDMVRIMYLAACGHKDARTDPTVMGALTAFEMATVNAAQGLSWQDAIGSLEAGKRADIVVVDTDAIEWHPNPIADPVANLVYSASGRSVRSVVIDGHVVLDEGVLTTLDEREYLKTASAASARALDRLNLSTSAKWPVR